MLHCNASVQTITKYLACLYLTASLAILPRCHSFIPPVAPFTSPQSQSQSPASPVFCRSQRVQLQLRASTTTATEASVATLKKVLEREYVSFFDPMRTEYYSKDVTFDDPMTNLRGVAAYQTNVDMLASRTPLGKFLFENASINLHSVTGGEVNADGSIQDIMTRWTLRVTAKVLPWTPTARFSGVSIYKVQSVPTTPEGVTIVGQTDYWDSVNLQKNGTYGPVDKAIAVGDFLNQLKPGGFQAATAAPELPYTLLRRGNGYEVRRYPSYSAVRIKYGRRDEGFGSLGAFTKGMSPLGPAIMTVQNREASDKLMLWPLSYCRPGQEAPEPVQLAIEKSRDDPQWRKCELLVIPSTVVAVAEFSDASMEPVVRKADRLLRDALERDGITAPPVDGVKFAQYDAIFSMGKRRGEVWIELNEGGHPW